MSETGNTPILDTLDSFFRGEVDLKTARRRIKALGADPRLLTDFSDAAKAMLRFYHRADRLPLKSIR